MTNYVGDFHKGATVRIMFTTVNTSGVATGLLGTPVVSCYENNTTTEFTNGITLTASFDSRTGLNLVEIDTSQSEYEVGKTYHLVITAGTIDGNSAVNYVVGSFSVEARLGIVDQVFKRDLTAITGEALYCLLNGIRTSRNRWTIVGTTLTVYKEDGTTVAFSGTIAVNGTGEITSFTPSA